MSEVADDTAYVLVADLYPHEFQRKSDDGALGVIGHPTHVSHTGDAAVTDLLRPDSDHSLEVAISERMRVNSVMQTDRDGLRLRLLSTVDLMQRFLPKVELAQSFVVNIVPKEASLAFSEILVSSISKRWIA